MLCAAFEVHMVAGHTMVLILIIHDFSIYGICLLKEYDRMIIIRKIPCPDSHLTFFPKVW